MKFKTYLKESRLDKLIDNILSKYNDLREGTCVNRIKSAIAEFIEISEFKPLIDRRKRGITINGEFRGGESGSKHIEVDCFEPKMLKKIIEDLNNNIQRINDSL